jgi:hypothetical protein
MECIWLAFRLEDCLGVNISEVHVVASIQHLTVQYIAKSTCCVGASKDSILRFAYLFLRFEIHS